MIAATAPPRREQDERPAGATGPRSGPGRLLRSQIAIRISGTTGICSAPIVAPCGTQLLDYLWIPGAPPADREELMDGLHSRQGRHPAAPPSHTLL